MKRNRILLLVIAASIIVILALLLLLRPKRITQLTAGDVAATNIRFADVFENTTDNELRYFSGSTIVNLKFPTGRGDTTSSIAFDHLPFGQVDRFSTGSEVSVVRAEYSRADSLLNLNELDSFTAALEDGRNWFVAGSRGAQPVPLSQSNVTDCAVEEVTVYCLVRNEQNTQNLVSFEAFNNTTKDHGITTPAVTLIAVRGGKLLMRDFSGKGYVYKDGSVQEFAQNIGEIKFDESTGKAVASSLSATETSEEGGAISTNDKPTTLRVFDIEGNLRKEISTQSSSFSVSRGYVITLKNLNKPTSLSFYSIDKNEEFTILITQGASRVTNTIREVHILREDFSLLGVVTTSNQLVAYSTERYLAGLPAKKLPIIRTTIQNYGFQYNIPTNRLTVYYPTDVPNTNLVSDSLLVFQSVCDCDVNQIAITWEATAFEPGH